MASIGRRFVIFQEQHVQYRKICNLPGAAWMAGRIFPGVEKSQKFQRKVCSFFSLFDPAKVRIRFPFFST